MKPKISKPCNKLVLLVVHSPSGKPMAMIATALWSLRKVYIAGMDQIDLHQ